MRSYLERISGPLPEADWLCLSEMLRRQEIPAAAFILRAGEVCRDIWYLEEGAVRFFEGKGEREHTTHFFLAPAFFTVYHSVLQGLPSEVFIRATERCRLWRLPHDRLQAAYAQSHHLEHIGRLMAEQQFIAEYERRRLLLHTDALGRYEHLERHQPEVLKRFSQKDIASYLGITPVSLSRLRRSRQRSQ